MKYIKLFEMWGDTRGWPAVPRWLHSMNLTRDDAFYTDNDKLLPNNNMRKRQDSDYEDNYRVSDLNVELYIKEFSDFDIKYRKKKVKRYIALQIMWMCGQSAYSTGMCKNPYEWALFHYSFPRDDTGEYFDSRTNIKLSTEFLFDKYYKL